MHKAAIVLTVSLLLANVAVGAAAKESGKPTSATLNLDLRDPSNATLTLEQRWEGGQALAFRQSLDAYFGNGDGILSSDELATIANAAQKDMQGKSFSGLTFDGTLATVANATVTFLGASGNISLPEPAIMRHTVLLRLTPTAGDEHAVVLTPIWNGTYDITIPDGLVATSGSTTGPMRDKESFTVTYGAAPLDTTPTETPATPPEASPNESVEAPIAGPERGVPGVGLALVLGAVAALAWMARRRR